MHAQRRSLLWINLLGGVAVLGSYAVGLATHPESGGAVWGGVPEGLRPLYTVSMFLAAAGYFAFSVPLLFASDPERLRSAGGFGFGLVKLLYAAILFPSALWMPLTFAALDAPGSVPVWAIRAVLAIVGLASLALLGLLLRLRPGQGVRGLGIARLGCAAFSFQTAILDALVWTAYFEV